MVRAVNVQLYASEINTEKLIESKFYETLPISISNVLSNFLYPSLIFLLLEYSIIKIKRINLRKITLNLNRVLVVPYRSDFESFIAMRHFQAVPLLFPWILPRLQPIYAIISLVDLRRFANFRVSDNALITAGDSERRERRRILEFIPSRRMGKQDHFE